MLLDRVLSLYLYLYLRIAKDSRIYASMQAGTRDRQTLYILLPSSIQPLIILEGRTIPEIVSICNEPEQTFYLVFRRVLECKTRYLHLRNSEGPKLLETPKPYTGSFRTQVEIFTALNPLV